MLFGCPFLQLKVTIPTNQREGRNPWRSFLKPCLREKPLELRSFCCFCSRISWRVLSHAKKKNVFDIKWKHLGFGVESKIRLVLCTETVQDNPCVGNTIPSAIVLREIKLRLPSPALVTDNLISGWCFIDPDDRSLTKRQVWTQGLCFQKVYWHDIRPPCWFKILKLPSWKQEPTSPAIDGLILDFSVSRTVNTFYISVLHKLFFLWHSYSIAKFLTSLLPLIGYMLLG